MRHPVLVVVRGCLINILCLGQSLPDIVDGEVDDFRGAFNDIDLMFAAGDGEAQIGSRRDLPLDRLRSRTVDGGRETCEECNSCDWGDFVLNCLPSGPSLVWDFLI